METVQLLHVAQFRTVLDRDRLLLLFASSNLAFLALDVAVAHSVNDFVPAYEWIPVFISPLGAATALWLAIHRDPGPLARFLHVVAMLANFIVGMLGFAFHLRALVNPLGGLSWNWLVFSAPVLAPLSFAGVALVGLTAVCREERSDSGAFLVPGGLRIDAPISKTQHLLWFVGLGFAGATGMSFLDHGQYGYEFFEWIPVAVGCFATIAVCGRALTSAAERVDDLTYFWTMIVCIVTGIVGFAFHLSKDTADSGAMSIERMRSFAPIFAPMLFSDLGILGLLVMLLPADGEHADAPQLSNEDN